VNADWWAAAQTPSGLLWFNGSSWGKQMRTAHRGPLFRVDFFTLASVVGLPPGNYTVFFGVDLTPDGQLNQPLSFDSVAVSVR